MIRFLTILFLSFSLAASSQNPYYLVAKKNTNGVEYIRLSWKADRRDLTVRNLVTYNGSSTFAGFGASTFDSSVVARTSKYLDDLIPGALQWYTFAASGQSARNWIDYGPNSDAVRNAQYSVTYSYNNNTIKEYPKIAIIQDASNWVIDGVSNAVNQEYIRSIAAKFVQHGAQVFIVSPQPRDAYTTPQKQQIEDFYFSLVGQYVTNAVQNIRFVKVYDTLVQQPGKTIVSAFSANDGIHLNNAGHKADFKRIQSAIDSVFAITTNISKHEIEVADSEFGPWTSYNNNVHPDTGFVNIPLSYAAKYFRVRTVYTNATVTAWSNIATSGGGPRTLTPIEITTGIFNQHNGFYRFLPDNYPEPGKKYPVIVFLHGSGQKGTGVTGTELSRVLEEGIPRFLAAGATMEFTVGGVRERFIVVAPQLPSSQPGWTNQWVDPIIDYVKTNLQVDTNRIYLTGLSLGGGGVYRKITTSLSDAQTFAAAAPVSATCDFLGTCVVADAHLPVWMFIDANDPQVGTQCNRDWVTAVNGCAGLTIPVIEKIYTGLGHSRAAWDHAYDTAHTYQNPNIYEWFLSNTRNSSAPLPAKVLMGYLSAGQTDYNIVCNQSVFSTPIYGDNATLEATDILYSNSTGTVFDGQLKGWAFSPTGSGTPTHKLVIWDKPDQFHNHIATFELCNPNTPPQCDAGTNKELNLPTNSVILNGSGSDAQGSVTYSWNKISGPAQFTISSATVAQPTISNLVAGTYVFRITVTDAAGATCTDDVGILVNPLGTYIQPKLYYDLTGENGKGKNGFDFKYNFDGIIGNGGWPIKNLSLRSFEQTTAGESTTPYLGKAGVKNVTDMIGAADPTDLSKTINITKIEYYDNSGFPDDTVFVYKLDDALAISDIATRWMTIARPDSLMTPIAYLRVQGGNVWRSVSLNVNCRYLLFRIIGKDRGGGWITYGNPGEMRISGTEYTGPVIPPNYNNAPAFVHIPLNEKIGVNNVTAVDTPFMATEGNIRWYFGYDWFYDQNVPYPNMKFNADHFGDGHIIDKQGRFLRKKGKLTYASVRGPNTYMLNHVPGTASAKGSEHDLPGQDPVSPFSYKALGVFAKAFVAKFGQNTTADVSDWYNQTSWPGAGTDTYSGLELKNEGENDLNANVSPIAYCALGWAAYDGWENRLGPGFGVKAVNDPNFKYISMGTVEMDYDWYMAVWWLSKFGRTDKKFVWDYINFHHYSTDLDSTTYISGTLEDRVGIRGRTPEKDSVYQKFNEFSRHFRSLEPTVKIMCSERGWDQWGTPAPDPTAASVWTPFSTPPLDGYNVGQAKAIVTLRDNLIVGASEIDVLTEFWLSGGILLETTPITFAASHFTTGWIQPDELSQSYWIRLFRDKYLGRYKVDSVYNIGRDALCTIRWKNIYSPDSLIYSYWFGGQTAAALPVTISIGNVELGAKKVVPVFNQITGTETAISTTGGQFSDLATSMPKFLIVKKSTSTNIAPNAYAGADQEITAPISTVILNGTGSSDPDGTINTYLWEKLSGPSGLIQSPSSAITNAIGLTPGTYTYQLTVIDNSGTIDTDTVIILVNPSPSEPAPDIKIVPLKKPKVIIVVQ